MQKGLFFYTNGFTGDVNDGAAPFTESEYRQYNWSVLTGNEADTGVLSGIDGELVVAGVATPLTVDTGRAQVYGFHYFNTASVNVAVSTPGIGDTGAMIVLRCNMTGANNPPLESQVRVLLVSSSDGNAAIPALVQTVDVTWDIPLATFVIDTSGDIWTDSSKSVAGVSDARVFAISPLAGMIKLREFAGDGTTGVCTFNYIQQNLTHLLIVGSVRSDAAAAFDGLSMQFNGDTGATYAYNRITANAGSINNLPGTTDTKIECGAVTGATGVADVHDPLQIQIPNYASALNKGCHIRSSLRGDGTNGASGLSSSINDGWWDDTGAITRVDLTLGSGNFETGTTITLYGMR